MYPLRISILIITLLLIPLKASALLDDTGLRLKEQFNIPLRWDNVEDREPWLDGVRPALNKELGFHTVRLGCGEYVTIRLYNGESLRIYNPHEEFRGDEIDVYLSNGSGLYITYPYTTDLNRRSILLTPPERLPYLVRIENPGKRDEIEIALFLSREEYIDDIAPYRDFIELPLERVRIQQRDKLPSEDFYLLTPHKPVSIKIEGGAGFLLESRLPYSPYDGGRIQPYHIEIRLDGILFQSLDHESLPVLTTPVYVNGEEAVVGRIQKGSLNIPEGRHEMEIESDAFLYIRLMRRDEPDYLLSTNEPRITARDIRIEGVAPVLRESLWGINEYDTTRLIDRLTPPIAELIANNLIKDNSLHEGSIAGVMLLRNSAMDDLEVEGAARLSYLSHTFYRDLLPQGCLKGCSSRFLYFTAPLLKNPRQPEEAVLHTWHLEEIIKNLPSSIFTTLTPETTLVYHLPERPSPSFLRLIVDKETAPSAEFLIGFDDAEPARVRLITDESLREDDFMVSETEGALRFLSTLPYHFREPTISGRFSTLRTPAPLIDAGYIDLLLPRGIKSVRLWSEGDTTPLVALQYRTSREYHLSQSAFLSYIKSMTSRHNLIISLLRDGEGAISDIKDKEEWGFPFVYKVREGDTLEKIFLDVMNIRIGEVYNRGYIERFSLMNPDIEDINKLPPGKEIYLPVRLMSMDDVMKVEVINDILPFYYLVKASATDFVATVRQQGNEPAIAHADSSHSDETGLLQADRLMAEGEYFLMENLLKGLFIYSPQEEIRKSAFDRLSTYYKEVDDVEGLMGLFSFSLLREPDLEKIPEFLKILLEEGEYEMLLKVGLLLPDGVQPIELLLRACIEQSWWYAFDTLIEQIASDEERRLWMAKRMLKEGRLEEALGLLQVAGEEGRRWYKWMTDADAIYKDITECKDKGVIGRWAEWEANHPGASKWRLADELLRDSAGGISLYNRARNIYSRFFISKDTERARLVVYGPSSLRIEVRPLHAPDTMSPLNGWIELNDNGLISYYPIINNTPSDALTIPWDDKSLPGKKLMLAYDVSKGPHILEIYSREVPLLIKVYEIEPELRIPILPPVNDDTITALISGCEGRFDGISAQFTEGFEPMLVEVGDIKNREIVYKMVRLLWDAEHNPERFGNNLVKAEALSLKNRHIPTIKTLFSRFYKKTTLLPFHGIIESAGIRLINTTIDSYTVPEMRIRASMLSPLMPGEYLLYGYEKIAIDMKNLKERVLEIKITAESIAYLPLEETEIYFELDGERVKEIPIGRDGREEVRLHLRISEGEHYLMVGISRPVIDQFIRIRIVERQGSEDVPLIRNMEKRYLLATTETPVVLAVEGPAVLYIERLMGDESVMNYMEVEGGLHLLKFYPDAGKPDALFRFYRREVLQDKPIASARIFRVNYDGFYMPEGVPRDEMKVASLIFEDSLSLGSQEDGTTSITGAYVRRRQPEAEERVENYLELRGSYRYFDESARMQKRYEVIGRIREYGAPTFGFTGHLAYRPLKTPYNLDIDSSIYLQMPDGLGKRDVEYSINLSASIIDKIELGTRSYHIPSITAFLRLMSMDDYEGHMPEEVDQDIFTPYKADHRYGLILSDTLYYTPWLDSILSLNGRVVLNEDIDPLSPDHLTFEAGWRQLIGNLQLDLLYQESHYLVDDDRTDRMTTRRLTLGASFERWFNLNKRLEIGARLTQHLLTGEVSGMLYLSLHTGKGRGYRDFHYGEIDFLALRQIRISYECDNNQVIRQYCPSGHEDKE